MADINRLTRLINGLPRGVDLQQNTLVVGSLKVGSATPSELTKALLDALIAANLTVDGEIAGSKVLVAHTAVNYTPTGSAPFSLENHLAGIDSALAAASVTEFSDDDFRIFNETDGTKKIAFDASAVATATVRTISMPDANVDLADVNQAILQDGSREMLADLDMDDNNIINVATPTAGHHAANKDYVDSIAQGLEPKGSVRLATATALPGDGPLSYDNGPNDDGVGATIQIPAPTFTAEIDGIEIELGWRILVKDQANEFQNGIYVVTLVPEDPLDPIAILTRAESFDGTPSNEVKGGDWVYVEEGSQAGTSWAVLGQGSKNIGVDDINWTKINKVTPLQAGDAVDISNDSISVKVDDQTVEISGDELQVKADGIDDTHIRLRNNEWLKARNDADDANVNILKVNEDDEVQMASFFKTPNAAPAEDYDVANKLYVDNSITAAIGAIEQEALVRIADAGETLGTGLRALRWAKGAESAGKLYLADNDAALEDNFYVDGLLLADGEEEDDEVVMIKMGKLNAPSHGLTVGLPVYLGAAGVLTQTAPTANDSAVVILGKVEDANTIDVKIQVVGIN